MKCEHCCENVDDNSVSIAGSIFIDKIEVIFKCPNCSSEGSWILSTASMTETKLGNPQN